MTTTRTTEALVQHEINGPLVLESVQLDAIRSDEVLVEIHATGICHTDISCMDGTLPAAAPNVLGHEGGGIVKEVGENVQGLAAGDKVLLSYNTCGKCVECNSGHPAYCHLMVPLNFGGKRLDNSTPVSLKTGEHVHSNFFGQSSFARQAVVSSRSVVKVPQSTPLELFAPLGCGLQTGAGAVFNSLDVTSGSSLVVFGVGAVGLSGIMAGKIRGANPIIAVDVQDTHLHLALKLGATHAINSTKENAVEKIRELCPPNGAKFALDASGVPKVIESMIDSLGTRGKAATVGAPTPGRRAGVDVFQHLIMGRAYVGSCEGDSVAKEMLPYLIEQHDQGRFPLEEMITTYDIKDYEKAFEDVKAGKTIKAVLKWV
ncbi:hypothetical protein A1O1_06668 [Capronia coronata CBS 617.96]|uniref:Enoyl reductase (ER) domain-containing protein n=1 Tax=Capronia coronata CBS 617.96 TaxID=1182541 RepID=W9Y1D5_9EURO|nr:uncharacterized protein A1O1_06668 [Capronia coronata CBS 617.96]EXJ86298.1 hypothetical protein A1O1_06668 [Capronia coronata CBS 617.96]